MKKYSPSSTNQFLDTCPFQWKLLNIDGVEPVYVPNHKSLIGRNVHMSIAEYYKHIGDHPTAEQVQNVATASFSYCFDETLKAHRAAIENMMYHFIEFEKSRINCYVKPILVEKRLEDERFVGIIDYFDGKRIIDWKTGNLMMLGDSERRQGKIYNILLNHNGYAGEFKVYFVTLANGRCLELPQTTNAWMNQQLEKMFNMVQNNNYPKNKTGLCNYCDVQMECEFDGISIYDGVGWRV